MVVFGGYDYTQALNDTWFLEFDDPGWFKLTTYGEVPPPTLGAFAAYDSRNDRVVVYPTWTRIETAGEGPDRKGSTVYDPVGNRMIVLSRGRIWILSLGGHPAWESRSIEGDAPLLGTYHMAAFDPVRSRMILQGGRFSPPYYQTGATWVITLGDTPSWETLPYGPARYHHTGIYDPVRDRIIVFGGHAACCENPGGDLSTTWELSLGGTPAWRQIPVASAPLGRSFHTAVYDPLRNRMVICGGSQQGTWELSLGEPPSWAPIAMVVTAKADAYPGKEDQPLTVPPPGVLGNDAVREGHQPPVAVLDSGSHHGTLTLGRDGSFSYRPDPDFNGNDAFTYVAESGITSRHRRR